MNLDFGSKMLKSIEKAGGSGAKHRSFKLKIPELVPIVSGDLDDFHTMMILRNRLAQFGRRCSLP